MVLSVAVVSVLVVSLLYNNITFAGKPVPQPNQVEVTNFPLDDEGNLRTTIVQTSAEPKIMVVFNETLTVSSSVSTYTYLTSFNTSGFRYGFIMARATGSWEPNANIHIHIFDNNFGIKTQPYGAGYTSIITGTETTSPNWGTGTSARYEIHSAIMDFYLQVYNSNVGFDGLLTIVVYLTN